MNDMHVHTEFSCDSDAKMEDYLISNETAGLSRICFTDHVDYNKMDEGFGYYRPDVYMEAFARANASAQNCQLLRGLEFSEPHIYKSELQHLSQLPYDFIIGSVHWIGELFPSLNIREKYSAPEFFKMYWGEILETVEAGGFDCLGHMDFPKRYYKEVSYDDSQIRQICRTMLENNIILEINTSSLRRGMSVTMPETSILEIYKDCGGRYVTLGSDAHEPQELAFGFATATELMKKIGLKEVWFQNRKMIICEETDQ